MGVRLRRLVDSTVDEVHRRRRVAGTLSFDDLLTQLRDALGEGSTAVAALSRRFRVALIDEFQDTDPVQWEIFARLFGGSSARSPLVLVADPKQAIYAFRGANVHTYLEAAQQPGMTRFTLGVNRRSDGALIAGLGCLFKGVTFGDPRIKFVPVKPAPERQELRLTTDDGTVLPALGVRLAIGDDLPRNTGGAVPAAAAEAAIARDLALQLQQLLEKAWIPSPGDVPRRRVRPGSIAVLVGTNAEAERFQAALGRQAIPAVVTRSDSVLRSAAATQWRWLLTALARPADPVAPGWRHSRGSSDGRPPSWTSPTTHSFPEFKISSSDGPKLSRSRGPWPFARKCGPTAERLPACLPQRTGTVTTPTSTTSRVCSR